MRSSNSAALDHEIERTRALRERISLMQLVGGNPRLVCAWIGDPASA